MTMNSDISSYAAAALQAVANAEDAATMQAYMKSEQPFYGVKKPARRDIERDLRSRFVPVVRSEWERNVLALWGLPHREEQYLAIAYARAFRAYQVPESLALFKRLIREGAWWDLVDEISAHVLGPTWLNHRRHIQPLMAQWIDDETSMWIRRAALLGQIRHKQSTDATCLFNFCLRRCHEQEFFIRKAIGWSLREYAKCNPEAVHDFVIEHRGQLSALSIREADRQLARTGHGVR